MQFNTTKMAVLLSWNLFCSQINSSEHTVPEGIVSESVESRLLHSASGFSAPVSCGTIRPGHGAKMAEVTTALCAERNCFLVKVQSKGQTLDRLKCRFNTATHTTFNSFPEVIAVSAYRCELAQVVVSAPDVHVLILWATDYEGVVVAVGR